MAMPCEAVLASLSQFGACEDTLEGSRIATHCLYPSHESVHVYVVKMGDDYRVHDGCGAYRSAWAHGRDEHLITRAIIHEAEKFQLSCVHESIVAPDVTHEWLANAILSVANASAMAAARAVSRISQSSEKALVTQIDEVLHAAFVDSAVSKEVSVRGKSGGERHFDFAIRHGDDFGLLINAVSPHRGSVNSKYVAFSDTDLDLRRKFAVFDRPLDAGDTSLLQQVASIVPLAALRAGAEKAIERYVR